MSHFLYHYSKVKYSFLLTRELQTPPLTLTEKKKEIQEAAEVSAPGPYYKHISFFAEPAPLDILGSIFGNEHKVWYPGSELYEYKVSIDQLPSFTFRLAESKLCESFLQTFEDSPDFDRANWFKKRYIAQVKAGEIGETKYLLGKVIEDIKGTTKFAYVNSRKSVDWEYNKNKYAAHVPHLMIYFNYGKIHYESVKEVVVGNNPY